MMPVVRDYVDWWIIMTLDGFVSHLEPAALLIFSKHKFFSSNNKETRRKRASQTINR